MGIGRLVRLTGSVFQNDSQFASRSACDSRALASLPSPSKTTGFWLVIQAQRQYCCACGRIVEPQRQRAERLQARSSVALTPSASQSLERVRIVRPATCARPAYVRRRATRGGSGAAGRWRRSAATACRAIPGGREAPSAPIPCAGSAAVRVARTAHRSGGGARWQASARPEPAAGERESQRYIPSDSGAVQSAPVRRGGRAAARSCEPRARAPSTSVQFARPASLRQRTGEVGVVVGAPRSFILRDLRVRASGRVRSALPSVRCEAMIWSGAFWVRQLDLAHFDAFIWPTL